MLAFSPLHFFEVAHMQTALDEAILLQASTAFSMLGVLSDQ